MGRVALKELYYFAGFFDGEGAVMLSRQGKYIRLTVAVSQDTDTVLEFHKRVFGGHVYSYSPPNRPDAVIFQWKVNGEEAVAFLEKIMPGLIIKKWQATLAIEAWQNRHNKEVVDPILKQLKEFRNARRKRSAIREE